MGDRQTISPERAFEQMNAEIAENLRRVQKRILSPSSTGDTFTAGAQPIIAQDIDDPSAPFTVIAQLDALAGSWLLCGTTTALAWTAGLPSDRKEVVCRICVDGVMVTSLDRTSPMWLGFSFSPITRATLPQSALVTLELRVSGDADPIATGATAVRTRLVVSPY